MNGMNMPMMQNVQNMNMNPMFPQNAMPMNMPMPMNIPMNLPMNQLQMQQSNFKYVNNYLGGMFMPNANPLTQMPLATSSNIMNLLNKSVAAPTGEYRKVYVGKIPPGISDTFILKLLETCGNVASWKRGTDHNARPRGFGFCEYHSVESMLKCLRLLNHLKLEEGYELSVNLYLLIF
jgi:RNA recognition motif-containing protein